MDLSAKITGIRYKPLLCAKLKSFAFKDLERALATNAVFILNIDKENNVAISWWVSAKRTRSYPYARVYDTLNFAGKKITIIPVVKDEGKEGDRDFLQWDTISLMSLLGVYVIVGYYVDAERSARYRHKITNQRFDIPYIKRKIKEILSYQSDALHWNLSQIDKIGDIGQKALESYEKISKRTKVEMHSKTSAERRIKQLQEGRDKFMSLSRQLAEMAQRRESVTEQPKEHLAGTKGVITIKNYLGGFYYFTADEVEIKGRDVYLIEAKHSKGSLPSIGDIKDGLIKMILFTNLENVKMDGKNYNPKPVLKLTIENHFDPENLNATQKRNLELLNKEAKTNGFAIKIL
jgi:DNA-dependent RNA polymerase auxiliary subunit epsilon